MLQMLQKMSLFVKFSICKKKFFAKSAKKMANVSQRPPSKNKVKYYSMKQI